MEPIRPAPVISTSSPVRGNDKAACVALPKGSMIDAISSLMRGSSLTMFEAGTARYSAKAPSRFTPIPTTFSQTCSLPRRQLRQCPQAMCPSPVTRSPIFKFSTPLPISTISPAYSCPMIMGVLMVRCDQSSHL